VLVASAWWGIALIVVSGIAASRLSQAESVTIVAEQD
jgi:hypothetical protein